MAARDLTNGFANRFLFYWAERSRLLPFPKATPTAEVDRLAGKVLDVLRFCEAERWAENDNLRVELSPAAVTCWSNLYRGELNDRSHGEHINALIERRAPMLLRLAMLFALTDCVKVVEVHHINAALAWIRYSTESVKFIFGSAADEAEVAEVNETAAKILQFIGQNKRVTRKQITRDCFKGHASKDRLDAALDELLSANPPRIVVEEDRSQPGRPTKFYTNSTANYANKANNKHRRGLAGDFEVREQSEQSELTPIDSSQVRIVREQTNRPETRMDIDCSLTSHSSQPETENSVAVVPKEQF